MASGERDAWRAERRHPPKRALFPATGGHLLANVGSLLANVGTLLAIVGAHFSTVGRLFQMLVLNFQQLEASWPMLVVIFQHPDACSRLVGVKRKQSDASFPPIPLKSPSIPPRSQARLEPAIHPPRSQASLGNAALGEVALRAEGVFRGSERSARPPAEHALHAKPSFAPNTLSAITPS